jgi:hypothetical protein
VNLRKDHCRNLHSRTTREPVIQPRGSGGNLRAPTPCGEGESPNRSANNVPRRGMRQGTETKRCAPPGPSAGRRRQHGLPLYTKRLSATDISALASMKNVAKCDTWCELQNPVNHRVFERKLRPKPLGRGHVCLGVTRSVAPQPEPPRGVSVACGADNGLPWARPAAGINTSPVCT